MGKSTKAEVLATLQTLSFADPATLQEVAYGHWDLEIRKNLPATLIGIDCRQPHWQCAGLVVSNDKLVSIGLFPNYDLTLREAVDYLGTPDYVRAVSESDPTICKLILWWTKQQIELERSVPNGEAFCKAVRAEERLDPTLTIQRIYYNLPQRFSIIPMEGLDRPWPGFKGP